MPSQDAVLSQEGNTEKEMNVGSQTVMSQVSSVLFVLFNNFIFCFFFFFFFFLAVLGLCSCGGSSPVVASGTYSLVVVCRLLIAMASLVTEHGL